MAQIGSILTELAGLGDEQVVQYYELVKIETSTPYYLTNAPHNIIYDGTTYESLGALLNIDQIEDNMTFEVPQIAISVNGLLDKDDDGNFFIEEILGIDYIDKPVTIFRHYFAVGQEHETAIGLITDKTVEMFKGFIDTAVLQFDPSAGCSVAIEISSHWVTFDKVNGRHTNSASQTQYATVDNSYGTDTGLDNCDEVQKEIIWKEVTET